KKPQPKLPPLSFEMTAQAVAPAQHASTVSQLFWSGSQQRSAMHAWPDWHCETQAPPAQRSHGPHPPQQFASGMHVPLHSFCPAGQAQAPFRQLAPPPQSASLQQVLLGMQRLPHRFLPPLHFRLAPTSSPVATRPASPPASSASALRRERVPQARTSASNRVSSTSILLPPPGGIGRSRGLRDHDRKEPLRRPRRPPLRYGAQQFWPHDPP